MAGTDRCNHARNQCTQLLYSPYSPTYFVIARQAQSISIASHRFYTARFYTARLFGTSVVPVRVFRKRMMDTGCSHELGCRSVPPSAGGAEWPNALPDSSTPASLLMA